VAGPGDVEKSLDGGFSAHIRKPVAIEELLAVIARVCA